MLHSSSQFIDILHSRTPRGIIASLDVESLFTNVPIEDIVQITLKQTYEHTTMPPPMIPKEILTQLLLLSTKEPPFQCPNGTLYQQIDGVAMGSPFGPTFANFYMGHIENTVFQKIS